MADLETRLRVASAAAARDVSDAARAFAATAHVTDPAQRVRAARELRLATVATLDLSVLLLLVTGSSWSDVTQVLGRADEGTVRAYFDPILRAWLGAGGDDDGLDRTAPYRAITDAPGTGEAVDQWLERSREVYDPPIRTV